MLHPDVSDETTSGDRTSGDTLSVCPGFLPVSSSARGSVNFPSVPGGDKIAFVGRKYGAQISEICIE